MKRSLIASVLFGTLIIFEGRRYETNGGLAQQAEGRRSRQLQNSAQGNDAIEAETSCYSLLNRGVYIPDKRFNAFVEGLMVNMVSEVRRRGLDPLYFRVNDDGSIAHVPSPGTSALQTIGRFRRQAATALGGGVITGLSNMRRSRDAEVQMAGNITLVKSHWLMGPLVIIVDYRGDPSITRVKTELAAIQFDALTSVDRFGAEKADFRLNSPLFGYMAYYGNRTMNQQRMTELIVKHLLSENSFVSRYLKDSFEVASYDKIIPQFGADDSYYSVIQYLVSGLNARTSRLPIMQHLLQMYKELQPSPYEFQKRVGQVKPDERRKEEDVLQISETSTDYMNGPAIIYSSENNLEEGK